MQGYLPYLLQESNEVILLDHTMISSILDNSNEITY
jgi:hypothetical protein